MTDEVMYPEPLLRDVLERYDLVEVAGDRDHPVLVVTERTPERDTVLLAEGTNTNTSSAVDLREIGSSSPSPWINLRRQEYNLELRGIRGLEKYDQMRKGDGAVRGTLRLVKTPVLSARWFVQPASTSTRDVNAAEFVHRCLFEKMTISWSQVLVEALLMMEFGYYMFEKVYKVDEGNRTAKDRGKIVYQKLAPRHPMDVKQWKMDGNGGPDAVEMFNPEPGQPEITIPIEKLAVFSFDREAGNMEGVSVLRSAYKHWFYKEQLYKIDAIQKERHGIGIPIIKLPVGFSPKDKALAEELGRNIRTNERAHVVLPPMWELMFAKIEGQPVDALTSIAHHDSKIRENVVAQFLEMSGQTDASHGQDMFLKGTRFVADIITEVFNFHCIPMLIDYNFSRVGYPRLKYRRIGEEQDWRTMSFALRNLVGAGLIIPDDPLEAYVRDFFDLPLPDPDTARQVATPQNPGTPDDEAEPGSQRDTPEPNDRPGRPGQPSPPRVGPPRQGRPSSQPPRSSGGNDRSGG